MRTEDFDQLSYASKKEIVELRNWAKKMLEENDETIQEHITDSVLHEFLDKTGKFAYNIKYAKPNEAAGSNYYLVYSQPSSLTSTLGSRGQQNFEEIKKSFQTWLSYVKKNHEIDEEFYNPFKQFYETEFKDFFINSDSDAEISPFDLDRQEILFYFLTYAETKVSQSQELSENAKSELAEDIKKLKADIPVLTKKATVKSLSKFAQKIKLHSNSLFHLIFDVLKKEAIKNALYKGLDYIPYAIETVKGWLSL